MSGPQFANLQTYARKSNKSGNSVKQIIDEGNREAEYSLHVDSPKKPRALLGDPAGFQKLHDDHVAARTVEVKMKDGTTRKRAIRQDRHTMASVVMSYPVRYSAITIDADRAKLAAWEARNIAFLKAKYGNQLKVVFAHDDETHPHLHAWLFPDDPGADAKTLPPGKLAKGRGVEPRAAVKLGNRAYKDAMTKWQDEHYEAVGAPEALTRLGPNRQRLSRAQYRAHKNSAQATAQYRDDLAAQLAEETAELTIVKTRRQEELNEAMRTLERRFQEQDRLEEIETEIRATKTARDTARKQKAELEQAAKAAAAQRDAAHMDREAAESARSAAETAEAASIQRRATIEQQATNRMKRADDMLDRADNAAEAVLDAQQQVDDELAQAKAEKAQAKHERASAEAHRIRLRAEVEPMDQLATDAEDGAFLV